MPSWRSGSAGFAPPVPDMNGELIEVTLARIETKLDGALTQGVDHEGRIRVLERKVWQAAGLASVVGGTGAAALAQFLAK